MPRKFKELDYGPNYPGPQDVNDQGQVKPLNPGPGKDRGTFTVDKTGVNFTDGRGNPSSALGAFTDGSVPSGPSKNKPSWAPNMHPQDAQRAADTGLKKMNE